MRGTLLSVGGGSPGAGAGHIDLDITAAHIGPGTGHDPPGVDVFYVDHNIATFTGHGMRQWVTDDPDFLDDSGIPAEPGHYSLHPAPGVTFVIQVAYRPAQ
jgi:hypothetical protein